MTKSQAITTKLPLILKSKFIPKREIIPNTLGWVRPDGIIIFQTSEAAEKYAKNKCVSALNIAQPYEKGVLVKDNQILGEVEGDVNKVDMSKYIGKMAGAAFFHGHPKINGNPEAPLSLPDYLFMVSQKIKKIVAFNQNGEHSTLIQKPQKSLLIRLLSKKWQDFFIHIKQIRAGQLATKEFAKKYSQAFPKEVQEKLEQTLHADIGLYYGNHKKIKAINNNNFTFEECMRVSSTERHIRRNGKAAQITNDFWEKISEKLNCIYETNFSNLKKHT